MIESHEAEMIIDAVHAVIMDDYPKRASQFCPRDIIATIILRRYGPDHDLLHREGARALIVQTVDEQAARMAQAVTDTRIVETDKHDTDGPWWQWQQIGDDV